MNNNANNIKIKVNQKYGKIMNKIKTNELKNDNQQSKDSINLENNNIK